MRSPLAIAALLTLALVLWLASRPLLEMMIGQPERPAVTATSESDGRPSDPAPTMTVQVTPSIAEPVQPELVVNGRTEPARAVHIRAETNGRVVETPAAKGSRIETGAALVQLDLRDRASKVKETEAALAQRELQYDAASRLGAKQFQSEVRVAEALAELEKARAQLDQARLDLERITITAPFAGVLERRMVEIGDFVRVGDEVARIIELDPLLVAGDAPETLIGRFRSGQPGVARLIEGQLVQGRIGYVANESDPATRTFRVELQVPNPDLRIPAGMSARIIVRQEPVAAHRVSAAALVLDDQGQIGIRHVDQHDMVRFAPVQIIRADSDAIWLAGLPESIRLITAGQGFVADGEKVRVQAAPQTVPMATARQRPAGDHGS